MRRRLGKVRQPKTDVLTTEPRRHVCIGKCVCRWRRVVTMWRESLATKNPKAAQSLANPAEYENLFPGLQDALKTEQFLTAQRQRTLPAGAFPTLMVSVAHSALVVVSSSLVWSILFLLITNTWLEQSCSLSSELSRNVTVGSTFIEKRVLWLLNQLTWICLLFCPHAVQECLLKLILKLTFYFILSFSFYFLTLIFIFYLLQFMYAMHSVNGRCACGTLCHGINVLSARHQSSWVIIG